MNILKKVKILCKEFSAYGVSLRDLKKTEKEISARFQKNKELTVVFLMQYVPSWLKLEPVYKKMKTDSRFHVHILCIPDNTSPEKALSSGMERNETFEYFVQNGYEAINGITENGEWYDLKSLEPDVVFTTRSYNDYMPTEYKSETLRKYTLICNILYAYSLNYNGLKVCLNRDFFKDVFCYFAANIYDQKFYEKRFFIGVKKGVQKCFPNGSISLESMLSRRCLKEAGDPKTVIWAPRWSTDSNIGGSNFFNYKDVILRWANEHPEIRFIVRPHPLMFQNFRNTGEMTQQEELDFRRLCDTSPNIVLDESKEYAETFWKSDLLIMDFSSILPEYYLTGKPIIYCHSNVDFGYSGFTEDLLKTLYQVKNSNDLEASFRDWINGNDYKYDERRNLLETYFNDVENSSQNVINTLINSVDELQ